MSYIDPGRLPKEISEMLRLAIRSWDDMMTTGNAANNAAKIRDDAQTIAVRYPRYKSWVACKALSWAALMYEKHGDISNAILCLEEILRSRAIDPFQRTTFYLNLGALHRDLGQSEQAALAWKKGIAVGVKHQDTTVLLILKQMASSSLLKPLQANIEAYSKITNQDKANLNLNEKTFVEMVLSSKFT